MRCKARVIRVEMTGSPECSLAISFISRRGIAGVAFDRDFPDLGAGAGGNLKSYVDLVLQFVTLL